MINSLDIFKEYINMQKWTNYFWIELKVENIYLTWIEFFSSYELLNWFQLTKISIWLKLKWSNLQMNCYIGFITQMAIWLKLKWSSFGPKLNHMAPKLRLNDVALKLDLISHMASN